RHGELGPVSHQRPARGIEYLTARRGDNEFLDVIGLRELLIMVSHRHLQVPQSGAKRRCQRHHEHLCQHQPGPTDVPWAVPRLRSGLPDPSHGRIPPVAHMSPVTSTASPAVRALRTRRTGATTRGLTTIVTTTLIGVTYRNVVQLTRGSPNRRPTTAKPT